nr:MAG TPA: hypothetical protein [Caudoviricetes sp.]
MHKIKNWQSLCESQMLILNVLDELSLLYMKGTKDVNEYH